MSPLVLEFLRRYPDVHVDLVTEGRLVDIVADGFGLGVRRADLVPADMIALPVERVQRYAVVASPGYLKAHGKPQTPSDLYAHQCIRIRLPNGALFRWHFENRAKADAHCETADRQSVAQCGHSSFDAICPFQA